MIDIVTASSLGIKATPINLPNLASSTLKNEMPNVGEFSEVLSSLGETAVAKLSNAENLSIGAIRGEVGIREVADAVMSAEQALQVGIAVRDKIVTAYLEISRMAI